MPRKIAQSQGPTESAEAASGQLHNYLSPAAFAQLSGLSLATVHRYLISGRLPKVQPGGCRCRVLIPRNALEQLMRAPEAVLPGDAGPPAASQVQQSQERLATGRRGPAPRWRK